MAGSGRTPGSTTAVKPALRIGLIGCGAIAQIAHLPILTKMRGVKVAALCDNDGAKARTLSQRFAIPDYFTDIDEMFAADVLDAVIVSTPNHLHEPHALSALRANVDVLCERPLALTARGVERLLTAAERVKRKIAASNPLRFRTDVQALAGFLRGGELGRVVGVRAGEYHRRGSATGWRVSRPESGGGAFLEYGLGLVDLALWLAEFPAPERVSAHFDRKPGASTVEDTMVALVICRGGLGCTFNVTWTYRGDQDRWAFELLATEGSARLSPLRVAKDLSGRPQDVTPSGAATRDIPLIQSHRAELAHFAAVVRGDAPYEAPVDQVTVMRVIEAAYQSAEEGREVRL
jgi:predicted dehydrogenase